jgi:hypothetical protein
MSAGCPALALRNIRRARETTPEDAALERAWQSAEDEVVASRRGSLSEAWGARGSKGQAPVEAEGLELGAGQALERAVQAFKEGALMYREGFLLSAGRKFTEALARLEGLTDLGEEQGAIVGRMIQACRLNVAAVCVRRGRELNLALEACSEEALEKAGLPLLSLEGQRRAAYIRFRTKTQ